MAPPAEPSAPPLPRIPKLKYRNPLPGHGMAVDTPPTLDLAVKPCEPVTPSSPLAQPSSRRSSSTASLTSPSLVSDPSSTESTNDNSAAKKKKKKSSNVFGFLSLKEPSQLALEQFAEQQRKQAASKGSSAALPRPPTAITKKLPANVPKVNSKWDGVPDAVKHRHSSSTAIAKERASLSSRGSISAQSMTTPSMQPSCPSSPDLPRKSMSSSTTSVSDRTIRPGNSSVSLSPSKSARPGSSCQTSDGYHTPRASSQFTRTSSSIASRTDSVIDDGRRRPTASVMSSDTRHIPLSTASTTDSVNTAIRDTADAIFLKMNKQPHQQLFGNKDATISEDTNIDLDGIPESHNFLLQAPSREHHKFDSPMALPSSSDYFTTDLPHLGEPVVSQVYIPPTTAANLAPLGSPNSTASGLPTLYEASLASKGSEESMRPAQDSDNESIAPSVAPSTIAPSVLSQQWFETPQQRLGLGGRIRFGDVLPWHEGRAADEKPKKTRLTMFGRASTRT